MVNKDFFNNDQSFFRGMRFVLWVFALGFLLAPWNLVRQDMAKAEAKRKALRPNWSAEKLFATREDLIKLCAEVSDDPQQFYLSSR